MARRIRSVKPEWLQDDRMADCSDAARVLSIALLLMADDKGRGRIGKQAAGEVFAGDQAKFDQALGELVGWYCRRYEVRGQRYYAVTNWARHQRIDKPSKPTTPEPSEGRWLDEDTENTDAGANSGDSREGSTNPPRALGMDLDHGNGSGPGGDQRASAPPPAPKAKVFRTDAAGTRAVDPLRASFAAPSSIELHAFHAWAKAFGKTGTTYDSRRAACLAERVGAGMSAQDADDAIAGALADDYVTGKKDGKTHDRLLFIFGDAERFEEFRDAGRTAREKPSGTVRKAPSIAERVAAEERAEARRRAEKGLPPIDTSKPTVHDPAELERIIASVGNGVAL